MVTWFTNLRLTGRNDFSFQFRKNHYTLQTNRLKLKCYATVCMLSFNAIRVDNYAAFFICTPMSRASDSMMALT